MSNNDPLHLFKKQDATEITQIYDDLESLVNRYSFDNPDIARLLGNAKDIIFQARVLADEEAGIR